MKRKSMVENPMMKCASCGKYHIPDPEDICECGSFLCGFCYDTDAQCSNCKED